MPSDGESTAQRLRAQSLVVLRLLATRQMLAVLAVACVAGAAQTMLRPLVAPYAISLGAGPFGASTVVAVLSLPGLVLGMPAGSAADRFGYRRVLASGGLVLAAGAALLVIVPAFWAFFLAILLLGLGLLAIALSAQGVATQPSADGSLDTRRVAAYGALILVGQLIGPTLGGVLTDAGGYAAAFTALALLGVVSSLLGVLSPAPTTSAPVEQAKAAPPAGEPDGAPPWPWMHSYRQGAWLLRSRGVAGAVVASALASALVNLRTSFLPLYLGEAGWSASAIGLLLSLASAGALLSRIVFPLAERRLQVKHLFRITLAGGGLCIGLAVAGLGTPMIVVATTLSGFLVGAVNPSSLTLLSRLVAERHRGVALGLRVTTNRIAQAITPLAFGGIAVGAGVQPAILVLGIGAAVVTTVVTRGFDRLASR